MRSTTLTGLVLATATLLGTGAAFAGPINVGSGGSIITTETSWESNTSTPGQILQGVVSVGTISNSIAAVNPVYVTGGGGQFLSAVFNGFTLQTVNLTGNSFQLFYSGGSISYYTSPTNPFASNTEVNSGTIAGSEANVTSGTLWEKFKADQIATEAVGANDNGPGANQALNNGNITLEISGVVQGGFGNVLASGTSEVYLSLLPGGLPNLIVPNSYTNPFDGSKADALYQGSANTAQCTAYGITPASPWQVCGSNNLSANVVPEPITLSLFGTGLAGAAAIRRRRKAKKA